MHYWTVYLKNVRFLLASFIGIFTFSLFYIYTIYSFLFLNISNICFSFISYTKFRIIFYKIILQLACLIKSHNFLGISHCLATKAFRKMWFSILMMMISFRILYFLLLQILLILLLLLMLLFRLLDYRIDTLNFISSKFNIQLHKVIENFWSR